MAYGKYRSSKARIGKRKRRVSYRKRKASSRFTISRAMRPESKSIYDITPQVQMSVGGDLWVLNACAQGVDADDRIGNRTVTSGISGKGFFVNGSVSSQVVRFILFVWRDNTPPTVANVLRAAEVNSPYDTDYARMRKILYDKSFSLAPNGQQGAIRNFKFGRKVTVTTEYNGAGSADWNRGVIYALAIGTGTVALPVDIAFDSIARFYDP